MRVNYQRSKQKLLWLRGVNDSEEFVLAVLMTPWSLLHMQIFLRNCSILQHLNKGPIWVRIMKNSGKKSSDIVPLTAFPSVWALLDSAKIPKCTLCKLITCVWKDNKQRLVAIPKFKKVHQIIAKCNQGELLKVSSFEEKLGGKNHHKLCLRPQL